MKIILLILLLTTFLSCEENNWDKPTMIKKTFAFSKEVSLVIPKDINDIIPCDRYGRGCLSVHRVEYKKIVMIFIEMDTEKNAKKSATSIAGWYKYNWVFDDVTGEPLLERFVQEAYGASKAEVLKPNP